MMNVTKIVFRIAAGLYAAAVVFLCFAKFDPAFIQEQSQLFHLTDKDVHFLMFLPFVPLMFLAFGDSGWNWKRTLCFMAVMMVTATAAASLIELIQGQTGYRGEDLWDAVAGIAGAAAGAVLLAGVLAVRRCRGKRRTHHGALIAAAVAALSLYSSPDAAAQTRGEFTECCDTLTARLRHRTGVTSDKLKLKKVLRRGKVLDFYFERTLGDYPWHEGDIEWFRKELKSCFPKKYSGRDIGEIFSLRSPLKDFVTPVLTSNGAPAASRNRTADPKTAEPDLVRRLPGPGTGPINFPQGLEHRNIALWQSHGYYYEQSPDRWEWQRACLFQTVEDLFTQSFVIQFLVPMLENAGACVMLPRERDYGTEEIVIDNDPARTSRSRGDFRTEGDWKVGGPGFADKEETISGSTNPFLAGTSLSAECGKSKKNAVPRAVWHPDFATKGDYAVYVSYRSVPGSTKSAHYTVRHLGGSTEFSVNQSIGGGTWIYLGTFPFDRGRGGCVILDGEGSSGILSADAVRFGGGMGNVARGTGGSGTDGHDAEVSGMPRFAEGARYCLQWYGAPESVWSQNEGKSDYRDDYMCRGSWVDWISGGSRMNRKAEGLGIPVDLAFAFHTDAGVAARDTTIGTMTIYTSVSEGKTELPSGERRLTSREYADIVQSQIVSDIRATYDPDWTRRGTKDRSYLESRTPTAPSMILELLSHQNFNDMKFGLDPAFRFLVSRSVYKGMLKYLGNRYGCSYAVQPLPVRSFAAEPGTSGENGLEVRLSWLPREDDLEPTAKPKGYILKRRIDDGVFDEGTVLKNLHTEEDGRVSCTVKVSAGHIHSFSITAYNDGGKSFPSEILSVGIPEGRNKGNILIVNNFTRVAAPSYIDTPEYAGFDSRNGGGADYLKRSNYIGETYQFRRGLEWKDDDAPGFGASWTDMAGSISAGNSFDYPYIHGKALMKLGYGFFSMSSEAFTALGAEGWSGGPSTIDLICGKQCTTPRGTGKVPAAFGIFPEELQERLRSCTADGWNVMVSGAYIGTELEEGVYPDSGMHGDGKGFAAEVLGYRAMSGHGSRSGTYRWTFGKNRGGRNGSFRTAPGGDVYNVEAPDGIVPADTKGKTFMRYADTGISAGIVYDGGCYRTACIGFPIETVEDGNEIEKIMNFCMDWFSRGGTGK